MILVASEAQCPMDGGALRTHSCLSNSSSDSKGNCSGFSRYAASTSFNRAVRAGRGRGSRMIASQYASPSNSGMSFGSDSASRARSSAGNFLIASSISSTALTRHGYNNRAFAARHGSDSHAWGAHASRVLVPVFHRNELVHSTSTRAGLRARTEKFATAGRSRQHARRVRYPEGVVATHAVWRRDARAVD